MHRTTSAMLVLTATAMLLAGCGSSTHASSIGTPVGADKPVANPQAVAYARAVNLRSGDVPGLVDATLRLHHVKPRLITESGPFGSVMEKCVGAITRPGEITAISSPRFSRNNARHQGTAYSISLFPIESVHSAVYVMASRESASRELGALDSTRGPACLKDLLAKQIIVSNTGRESLFNQITTSSLPSPLPGVRVYGLRMTSAFAFDSSGKARDYHEDTFGFALGRTLVTLTATGDPKPFLSATERRLLSLLYHRAQAHKLY